MKSFVKKDLVFSGGVALLAFLPFLINFLSTPSGSMYLGHQTNNDDQMVYAAWMRQAMDGHFFFDNRFTVDVQPRLTVHLYFFIVGLFAKLLSLTWAPAISRLVFSFFFVLLLGACLDKLEWGERWKRVGQLFCIFGAGIGYLVWHDFKGGITKPSAFTQLLGGQLPVDIFQPEGFLFPSMLTNGLFMVSLCLILWVFNAVVSSKDSPRLLASGTLAMGILMNIHSYDVLLVGLVLVGLLACSVYQKTLSKAWVLRAVFIVLGVAPAAIWFMIVLKNDPVFQARAATETYSPNFRQVLFGYLPLIALGLTGLLLRAGKDIRKRAGVGLFTAILLVMTLAAGSADKGYFVSMPLWIEASSSVAQCCPSRYSNT